MTMITLLRYMVGSKARGGCGYFLLGFYMVGPPNMVYWVILKQEPALVLFLLPKTPPYIELENCLYFIKNVKIRHF